MPSQSREMGFGGATPTCTAPKTRGHTHARTHQAALFEASRCPWQMLGLSHRTTVFRYARACVEGCMSREFRGDWPGTERERETHHSIGKANVSWRPARFPRTLDQAGTNHVMVCLCVPNGHTESFERIQHTLAEIFFPEVCCVRVVCHATPTRQNASNEVARPMCRIQ